MVIWTQGCHHNCKGCHNPQTHAPNGGILEDTENIIKEIKNHKLQQGITLSGGEPFLQVEALSEIAKAAKDINLDVWAYTGYRYEDLLKDGKSFKLLQYIDILVDGKFEIENKDISLKFIGSSNQRIIEINNYGGKLK